MILEMIEQVLYIYLHYILRMRVLCDLPKWKYKVADKGFAYMYDDRDVG